MSTEKEAVTVPDGQSILQEPHSTSEPVDTPRQQAGDEDWCAPRAVGDDEQRASPADYDDCPTPADCQSVTAALGWDLGHSSDRDTPMMQSDEDNGSPTSGGGGGDRRRPIRRKHRVRGKVKVCGVCGDKAVSHNFGAISCETCKAFFRRNAYKHKELQPCAFNSDCTITKITRRFCPLCRLNKCYAIGMDPLLILDDEERKARQARRELKKQQRRPQPAALVPNTVISQTPPPPPPPPPRPLTTLLMEASAGHSPSPLTVTTVLGHRGVLDCSESARKVTRTDGCGQLRTELITMDRDDVRGLPGERAGSQNQNRAAIITKAPNVTRALGVTGDKEVTRVTWDSEPNVIAATSFTALSSDVHLSQSADTMMIKSDDTGVFGNFIAHADSKLDFTDKMVNSPTESCYLPGDFGFHAALSPVSTNEATAVEDAISVSGAGLFADTFPVEPPLSPISAAVNIFFADIGAYPDSPEHSPCDSHSAGGTEGDDGSAITTETHIIADGDTFPLAQPAALLSSQTCVESEDVSQYFGWLRHCQGRRFQHVLQGEMPESATLYWPLSQDERNTLAIVTSAYKHTLLAMIPPPAGEHYQRGLNMENIHYALDFTFHKSVSFAKIVPEFKQLRQSDQIAALKASALQTYCIRAAAVFHPERRRWRSMIGDFHVGGVARLMRTIAGGMDSFHMFASYSEALKSVVRSDVTLLALLHCIVLFDPRHAHLEQRLLVNRLRDSYVLLLKHHLEWRFSFLHADRYLTELMANLLDVREVGEIMTAFYKRHPSFFRPLVAEVLTD